MSPDPWLLLRSEGGLGGGTDGLETLALLFLRGGPMGSSSVIDFLVDSNSAIDFLMGSISGMDFLGDLELGRTGGGAGGGGFTGRCF